MNNKRIYMKKTFYFIVILLFSCQCEIFDQAEKFFDPQDLVLLDLADINGFWQNVEEIDTTFRGRELEGQGYLGGITLSDEDNNEICITVYSNQDSAINAMEFRIANVSTIITEGSSKGFDNKWWYSGGASRPAVYFNQWNTIIEVIMSDVAYSEAETTLIKTAKIISKRVDKLSS